jgi:hypothetical protein
MWLVGNCMNCLSWFPDEAAARAYEIATTQSAARCLLQRGLPSTPRVVLVNERAGQYLRGRIRYPRTIVLGYARLP